MRREPIFVEIRIRASMDEVWRLTQAPEVHSRWDLRFSTIRPTESTPDGGYRFRYERRIPFHTIAGTGITLGEKERPDGTRTSALRFTTTDRLSPLGDGRGYWRYTPDGGETVFATGYTYEPGWGALIDRLVMHRLIGWMTAWSFDRLRIWAETGVEPERWSVLSVFALWRSDRPRASRCRRRPRTGTAMSPAPATLEALEAP